jgi:hypothetical protein
VEPQVLAHHFLNQDHRVIIKAAFGLQQSDTELAIFRDTCSPREFIERSLLGFKRRTELELELGRGLGLRANTVI